jgi:hypothetical protein
MEEDTNVNVDANYEQAIWQNDVAPPLFRATDSRQ